VLEHAGRHGRIAVRGVVSRIVGLADKEAPPDPDGVDAVNDRSGGPVVTQSLARHYIIGRRKLVEREGHHTISMTAPADFQKVVYGVDFSVARLFRGNVNS
jgi:hypothetical protein